ncbi:MAG: DUF2127 domain-containing protein [Caldilineales bacterium]|nr:DUF2127 domain-containing protein [Caldilineales bacterium]MDW8316843.1 DUF2127 domain-containing protein [Anaerolineae bacterium]
MVLVIVYIVLSLLSLVWSLLVFGFGGLGALFGTIFGAENMAMQGTNRALSGTLGLITAVLHLVVAYGLWNLKRWAWLLAVVALGVYVLTGIIGMFSGGFWALCCGFAGLAVPVAIFVYLLRPDVRGAFMNR